MIRFIIKRLLLLIPTLWGILTLVFFMIALSPGDPARIMLGERASKERLIQLRKELGLNQSLSKQYILYLKRILKGDLGKSIVSQQPVINEIAQRLPATIELSFSAIVFATVMGIILGVLAATKRNSWMDQVTMTSSLIGVSMPVFWLALVFIILFSVQLNIFPTGGRIDSRLYFQPITHYLIIDGIIYWVRTGNPAYFLSVLHHLILPTIALGTIPLAIIARTTRSSMLEVLQQDYIKMARSVGIPEHKVLYRYALYNALLPVITVIGIQFGMLLSGAILTETVFAWPGIGKWIYHAIGSRDFPAVQGGILFVSLFFVLINLAVDVLYSVLNPKIRLT